MSAAHSDPSNISSATDVAKRVYTCLKPNIDGDILRVNAYEALKLLEGLHAELLKLPPTDRRHLSGTAIDKLMASGHSLYQTMTNDPIRYDDHTMAMLLLASTVALGIHGSTWAEASVRTEAPGDDVLRQMDRVPIKLEEMRIYVSLYNWSVSTWWDDVSSELTGVCKEVMYVLLDDEFAIAEKMACAMALCSASSDLSLGQKVASPSTIALQSSTYLRQLQVSGHAVERINAIADMSDSEIGQQVIRDLITSFLMPRIELFPRPTTLFNGEATRFIMEHHPDIVRRAHLKAQLTGPHLWRDLGEGELERSCVILAGLAVYLAPDIDSVRKKSAFNGRVQLPFARGKPPLVGPIILLTQQRWSCYVVEEDRSRTLQYSGEGLVGLQRCALLFTHLYDRNIKNR